MAEQTNTILYAAAASYSTASYSESSSSYIYVGGSHDWTRNRKIDFTDLTLAPVTSDLVAGMRWNRLCLPIMPSNQELFLSGDYSFHILVSKTTMNEVLRIANDVGAGSFTVGRGLFDNFTPSTYYVNSNTAYLYKLNWVAGSTTFTL